MEVTQQAFLTAPDEDRPYKGDAPDCGHRRRRRSTVSRPGFQPTLWRLSSPLGSGKELLVSWEARVWMALPMEQAPNRFKLGL